MKKKNYVACLLVTSQEINKLKIKENNHLLIHHLYIFDIRHKCIIPINVSPKIY